MYIYHLTKSKLYCCSELLLILSEFKITKSTRIPVFVNEAYSTVTLP